MSDTKTIVQISMKAKPAVLQQIDVAAGLEGKSRTEFIMQAALDRAQDVILDRREFQMTDEQFEAFDKATRG